MNRAANESNLDKFGRTFTELEQNPNELITAR